MSCEEVRELFSDHLDGALSLEAEDHFGQHVGACPRCREELSRYEAATRALAALSPDPAPGFSERLARRLTEEGLLRREPRWGVGGLLPIAAGLAVFSIGLIAGRSTGPARLMRLRPLPTIAWTDACAVDPSVLPHLDPRALRAPPDAEAPDRVVSTGSYSLRLPRRLTSHGPYEPDVSASVEREGAICLPLSAPFGTRLALSVAPVMTGDTDNTGTFLVEIDPTRVLYARVLWSRDGLRWSLEGRAEAAELLDVAREIAAGTQVKGEGTDQTL